MLSLRLLDTLWLLTPMWSFLASGGDPSQLRLDKRSAVAHSPGLSVAFAIRPARSRLVCASFCNTGRLLAPQCLTLTYNRSDGACTIYYDSASNLSGAVPTPSGAALSTLTSSAELEVWSSLSEASVDTATTTSATLQTTTIATTSAAVLIGNSGNFTAGSAGRNGSVHSVNISATGCYWVSAVGAAGGRCSIASPSVSQLGGSGASAQGNFQLTGGDQLAIAVGQAGVPANVGGIGAPGGAGGGGGSFIWLVGAGGSSSVATLLVAAGGGGGASSNFAGSSASGSPNGSASVGIGTMYSGAGGTNGGPGAAGLRPAGGDVRGGPGAGWLADAGPSIDAMMIPGDGWYGRTRNQTWVGGSGGYDGGFGGGGAGASAGSAGGGGGYSGGGSGGGFTDSGGGGGSWCAAAGIGGGRNCTTKGGANPTGGGSAAFAYLGVTCP